MKRIAVGGSRSAGGTNCVPDKPSEERNISGARGRQPSRKVSRYACSKLVPRAPPAPFRRKIEACSLTAEHGLNIDEEREKERFQGGRDCLELGDFYYLSKKIELPRFFSHWLSVSPVCFLRRA